MRRLTLIFSLIVASVASFAASASGEDTKVYYIELDNAFGLVNGSPVKVAGVEAGAITDFLINSEKRAVAKVELSGPVAILGEDTICSTDPQSLIAEYFIDCTPKGDPIVLGEGSDQDRAEAPDIPVEQTRQTVQQDLVMSTLREPFRDRLTLLINEFGTALAGNAENLNEAIRRGAPALTETQKVFDLLASQNTIIRDLNVNSDRIISRLNESREDVVRFVEEAENTARVSAERREDLGQNFALLDDFLFELEPTMVELNELAVTGTPLARDLRAAAPGLTELSRDLPAFNVAGTDALVSLGDASVVGRRALEKGRDEIDQLGDAAKNSFSVSDNLAKFLRDIDDPSRAVEVDTRANRDTGRTGETGYTGMEGLLNYTYYQTLAINQFDEIGHLLHFSIFEIGEGPCASFNPGVFDPDGDRPGGEDPQPGVPNLDASAATTEILEANRCVGWLGDSQPGINEDLNLPPYDPSVCPEGSSDLELCDPEGATARSSRRSTPTATAANARDDATESPTDPKPAPPGATGPAGDGPGGAPADPGESIVPPVAGEVPEAAGDLGDALGGALGLPPEATSALPRSSSAGASAPGSANNDMLGYLFGT